MTKKIKIFFALCALVCTLIATVVMLAALNQTIALLGRIHPLVGQFAFWAVLSGVAATALYGAMLYLKLPPPLKPPAQASGPAYDRYLSALAERLRANPKLRGRELRNVEDIKSALHTLSADADQVIRNTASIVFLTTAVMQNGRLDGAVVFVTQIRMVWRIAKLYFQRPSLRQMLYLYSNVSVTAFLSASLEDLDLPQIVAPISISLIPAVHGAIPGMGGVSALMARSISNGAANAFLTLRVGEIARQYCEAVSTPAQDVVRRSATVAAVSHLGRIVRENSTLIGKEVGKKVGGLVGKEVWTTAWHKLWPRTGGGAEIIEGSTAQSDPIRRVEF